MTSPRPVSRRTATTAALWSAPVVLAAASGPFAAASGAISATLGFVSGGLANNQADVYVGEFTPVVYASSTSAPVRDILAEATFGTADGVELSDFALEADSPWVVVEELNARRPGVVVLAWSDATGLREGESPRAAAFSFRASGYVTSYVVALTSTSAYATEGDFPIATV